MVTFHLLNWSCLVCALGSMLGQGSVRADWDSWWTYEGISGECHSVRISIKLNVSNDSVLM